MKRIVLALGLLAALAAPSFGQSYPSKQIRLVVPYPPGGTADPSARLLSQALSSALGQPVVVDNRGEVSGIVQDECLRLLS